MRNKWIITVTVMLPTFIQILDTSVVNVSLDHIRGSLSAGIDETTWTITSYLVANAIIIPMTGWLSRVFGRKLYLMLSIGIFTLGSLLCGLSWNLTSLVCFRILQGIGGGGMQPIAQAILLESFPPQQIGTAMAVYGMGVTTGPIIGPLLGGWITDNWSWHWIFFINVPVGIIGTLLTQLSISDPPHAKASKARSIDTWGLAFLVLGLGSLQFLLDKGQREDWFESSLITWLAVIAAISIILLIIVELRTEHPIVDLRVFRHRDFALGNIIVFSSFVSMFGGMILLPIFVQKMMGYTSTLAGMTLAPGGLVAMLAMPVCGRLVRKIDSRFLLVGSLLVMSFSTYLMSRFNSYVDFETVLWPRLVSGLALAFHFVPLTTLTMGFLPKEELGTATALFTLTRNMGGSVGIALAATIFSRSIQVHHLQLASDVTLYDRTYQWWAWGASAASRLQGHEQALLYGLLNKEATMLAFNQAFFYLTIMGLTVLPLIFLIRRSGLEHQEPAGRR
jgi:DHA2 family multidrug resistance protein